MKNINELLKLMACPTCKSDLDLLKNENKLKCKKCFRLYNIENGIPIMIPKNL